MHAYKVIAFSNFRTIGVVKWSFFIVPMDGFLSIFIVVSWFRGNVNGNDKSKTNPLRDYEFQNSLQQFALNFLYLSVFAFC